MTPALVAIATGAAALYVALEKFRKTTHGDNPWSVDGFIGATVIMGHVELISMLTGASWNSVYRSEQVQRSLYEAKRKVPAQWDVVKAGAAKRGMTPDQYVEFLSKGTRHARGLAADFSKQGTSTAVLSRDIFELAKAGRVGKVKKVLDERDHAHVEWWAPGEQAKEPVLESL